MRIEEARPELYFRRTTSRVQDGPTQANEGLWGVAKVSTFRRHRRFTAEGEPAEYAYRLLEGVAEGYRISTEGRRQIVSFYSPGDFFGLEAGSDYTLCVDAITTGRVQCLKRTTLDQIMNSNSRVLPELWSGLSKSIDRNREHIIRLGLPATERVGSFLLNMCERLTGGNDCCLPMARREIADHLDLTIETVSRSLTDLRRMGIISVSGWRQITILEPQRLRRLTGL